MSDQPLSSEEWMRRYAARIMQQSDIEEHQAIEVARVGREQYDADVKTFGEEWAETPEDCADDEISCWDNDE